jgi:hypothetical protein
MNEVVDAIWEKVVGGLDWLKQVVFGEFEDHRDISAVIADMLVSFVPGVVIVTSARDLTAVILRLAKRPERREHVEEWMLLIACAIPLVLPILAAAAGAVAMGVGAIVGGIAGSEAGAVLRAVCLLLIKRGAYVLAEIVGFLRRFIKGDILKVLRDIRFAQYADALVKYIGDFIGKLAGIIQRVRAELMKVDAFHWLADVLRKLDELEKAFYAVQSSAVKAIPKALVELDIRLQQLLSEARPHNPKPAIAGVPAGTPAVIPAKPERVPAMQNNPLGRPEGTSTPAVPPTTGQRPNVHPETPRELSARQVSGAEAVAESQAAYGRANEAQTELGKTYEKKTTASDDSKTLSGWKNDKPRGFAHASAEDVRATSNEIGHELKPHVFDRDFPGQYNASHAEKQLSITSPNDPIGVSRPMCADCRSYFSKLAQNRGVEQVVTDPDGTRIFKPDGQVVGP